MFKIKLLHSDKEVAIDEMRMRSILPASENTLMVVYKDGEKVLGNIVGNL